MKNIPEKIYLQMDDDELPEDFNDLEVSWCSDRINENDIAYVREPYSPTGKESETGEQEDQDDLWDAFGNEVNKWKHPEDGIGFHCLTNHLKKNWTLTRKPLDR